MSAFYKLRSSNYVNYGLRKTPKLGEQSEVQGYTLKKEKLPPLIFEHNFPDNAPIPHYLTGGSCLASKQFIALLKHLGVHNFQTFSAVLFNPETGKERNDYYLFNVLGLRSAARMDQSSYDPLMRADSEGIDLPLVAFNELVLDKEKIRGLPMFRLAEEPISVIVNQIIIDGLKKHRPDEGWGMVIELVDTI